MLDSSETSPQLLGNQQGSYPVVNLLPQKIRLLQHVPTPRDLRVLRVELHLSKSEGANGHGFQINSESSFWPLQKSSNEHTAQTNPDSCRKKQQ